MKTCELKRVAVAGAFWMLLHHFGSSGDEVPKPPSEAQGKWFIGEKHDSHCDVTRKPR